MRVVLAALLVCLSLVSAVQAGDGLYELRVYTCEPGKLEALNSRFKNHTMRIFERHGIENVAYWTPVDESDERLIYLLKHKDADAAKASWDGFRNDPEWKEVAAKSREDHGKILAKAPEVTYMTEVDYSPEVVSPGSDRLYELRIYTTLEDRLDALNARFRDHTKKIFARHGLESYGYWTPTDERSQNTLVYVLDYDNAETAKAGWKAFGQDPEWQTARAASEADGKILAERPLSVYMKLTDYSPQSK
ncbi:NIPSNAP family protein [Thalassoglobus sp. JC818]|uniref:NIPSNAP family protein n=1 Tax=Thalassoglobus sp. JC818 TaxID=3232136 RepID=UPI0034577EDE